MPVNRVAENVFGTLGTICWSAQLVPQIWKSYRSKDTTGLSAWLVLCWGLSATFLGVYAIVQNLNIPLIVQPQLFGLLCMISWGQCQYYGSTRPKRVSLIIAVAAIAVLGAFETAMVFAIRPSSNHRAIQFFGVFSSVLLSLGLVTQYHEIYKRREVVGLSITFMTVDFLGGVFSDLSLAFKPKPFDTIAAITYSLVVVMDGVVILAAIILNPRARRRREAEAHDNIITNTPEMVTIPSTPSQRRTFTTASEDRGGVPMG
ncbi:PQ loop repeat-domain-containing protein [Mycena maculata]|uniref:PQ loop repeat-domain-containing protein n=1 Tax=Mycena maculata TaxID=230809 RepID=A0AAD7HJB0_9AGAR|nr:PQ loop repeat-domain-containing protein [Mycena maculata]